MSIQRATNNYYREEEKIYEEAYGIFLKNDEVSLILKKLCRHYEVKVPRVRFWGNRDSGSSGLRGIRLSNGPSMGLLIHEFGHYINRRPRSEKVRAFITKVPNKGTSHHGLHFQTSIFHIHTWAKSKGYWQLQLHGRRSKKVEKISKRVHEKNKAQTPEAIIEKKIEMTKEKIKKKEDAIQRYNKRLKYFQKLYGNKTKKARRSIGALKSSLEKYEEKLV